MEKRVRVGGRRGRLKFARDGQVVEAEPRRGSGRTRSLRRGRCSACRGRCAPHDRPFGRRPALDAEPSERPGAGEPIAPDLVSSLFQDPQQLVIVARYDTAGDAQLAKTQLENADIPCMLANAEQSGLTPMFEATEGGVQVKVPAARADEARALLASD